MMIKNLTALMRGYTVTGAKSFESTDGLAYSGTIYKDGAPVLRVVNTGTGAPSDLAYADQNAEAAFKAAALDYWRSTEGESAPFEPEDRFAAALLDADDSLRRIRRTAGRKTLFQLREDGPDQYRTIDQVFTPELAVRVRAHYGERLVAILNEDLATVPVRQRAAARRRGN
jgi:hypothetical protein